MRRERSPGALRSHGRAPCRWDPEVRKWPLRVPDEPPWTAGRQWKCQELSSNILLFCSVYKQNSTIEYGGNTRYAPPCYCPLTLRCPRGGGKSAFEILIHTLKTHPAPLQRAALQAQAA